MIRNNISMMNQLVDEGCGYINNDYEFVVTQSDEDFQQRWRAWGFSLRWNKFSAYFDGDCAILVASICLGLYTFSNLSSFESLLDLMGEDGVLAAILTDAFVLLPSDIANGIAGFFTSPNLAALAESFSIILSIVSPSTLIWKVLSILSTVLLPTIVDCVIILYNAVKYNRGVKLTVCWIPTWWDKWGISITPL